MSNWQSMENADKGNTWFAKDVNGNIGWTWFEEENWIRECWNADDYGNESASYDWWNPIEFINDVYYTSEQ